MIGLKDKFEGKGEKSGYFFNKLHESDSGFMYEISSNLSNTKHYEVFIKRINTQFDCISYPKSNSFGKYAWCYTDYNKAITKFNNLNTIK